MDHHHHPSNTNCKSILKRKSLEIGAEDPKSEDSKSDHCVSNHVNSKSCRQGILKKNAASFDDDSVAQKPILKNRCRSCDDETIVNFSELHSILKRKTSDPCDNSSEPHGILKRRETATVHINNYYQHWQPDQEQQNHMVDDEDLRPILKQKKVECCDVSTDDGHGSSYPKPILKKKTSDPGDDKRAMLKSFSSRSNSPAKTSRSKRLSVAERISNLESSIGGSENSSDAYRKPVKESPRNARDRSRFHTQPVTPSEIKAVKKYVVPETAS